MALLVMLSTVSFTIESHYCGEFLVDSSLFGSAQSCGMDLSQTKSSKDGITDKNCCRNQKITKKGQDNLNISIDKLSIDQQVFVASFTYAYINLFEGLDENVVPFKHYTPPLLVTDILVLDQTFLI